MSDFCTNCGNYDCTCRVYVHPCNCQNTPPPQEESVVLEGESINGIVLLSDGTIIPTRMPNGPVRITITPLKENKTDDK